MVYILRYSMPSLNQNLASNVGLPLLSGKSLGKVWESPYDGFFNIWAIVLFTRLLLTGLMPPHLVWFIDGLLY